MRCPFQPSSLSALPPVDTGPLFCQILVSTHNTMKISLLKAPIGGIIGLEMITFVEPLGLARLWRIAKEKLRLWPFPH